MIFSTWMGRGRLEWQTFCPATKMTICKPTLQARRVRYAVSRRNCAVKTRLSDDDLELALVFQLDAQLWVPVAISPSKKFHNTCQSDSSGLARLNPISIATKFLLFCHLWTGHLRNPDSPYLSGSISAVRQKFAGIFGRWQESNSWTVSAMPPPDSCCAARAFGVSYVKGGVIFLLDGTRLLPNSSGSIGSQAAIPWLRAAFCRRRRRGRGAERVLTAYGKRHT